MITIIEPKVIVESSLDGIMPLLERAGRTCYASEDKIREGSAEKFISNIIKRGHESVIEHASISVRFICDRACSHQLVRHRISSFSQASQRFIDHSKKGCEFICPPSIGIKPGTYKTEYLENAGLLAFDEEMNVIPMTEVQLGWLGTISQCYDSYCQLRNKKVKPEDARSVLPNATKTEVFTTMNLRMWRHTIMQRGLNSHAQWQIRGLFQDLLEQFAKELPAVFGDLYAND